MIEIAKKTTQKEMCLLHFSTDDIIGEPCGALDDEVALVPGRVVPQILTQQLIHVGQLSFPQLVGLEVHGGEGGRGKRKKGEQWN